MALNPLLSLQTQAVQMPDFAGAYERYLNNKAQREMMAQRSGLYNAQMEEMTRKRKAQAFRAARTPEERMQIDPMAASKLQAEEAKAVTESAEAQYKQAQARKLEMDTALGKLNQLGQTLGAAKDEATLLAGIGSLMQGGVVTREQVAPYLVKLSQGGFEAVRPELEQLSQQTLTVKEKLELARQAEELKLKQAEDARAAQLQPSKVAISENQAVTTAPDEQGLTPEQRSKVQQAEADRKFRASENAKDRAVTVQGQIMTDARQREANRNAADNKPLNEYETRNFGFFDRAKQATGVLEQLEGTIGNKNLAGQALLKYGPNVLQPEENQMYRQAKGMFLNAYLRRDSGAVITPQEEAMGDRDFFPQPGDGPKVLEQKRKARQTVLNALKVGAGRAPQRMGIEDAPAPSGGPKVGTVEDGFVFMGGDPGDQRNWKKK